MILKLYDKNINQRDLDRVLNILNGGGVIAFPTDTAYAMGCHALKERIPRNTGSRLSVTTSAISASMYGWRIRPSRQ